VIRNAILVQLTAPHIALLRRFINTSESMQSRSMLHLLNWFGVILVICQVADEYVALDTVRDGSISRAHLRRLTDRYALPVSDQHFDK